MARIRTIKPDFWTDEKLTECSMSARLFFVGTWNFADDKGNLVRSAKKLKMQVFPADSIECEPLIQELLQIGVMIEYEVGGEKYLHIKGFEKHQVINRPSKSSIPEQIFSEQKEQSKDDSLNAHGALTDGREGKGKEGIDTSSRTAPTKSKKPVKTPLPEDFCISERVRSWAAEKKHGSLERHFENFVSAAKRNGYTYADWDEALMEAIRKDWAKLGAPADSSGEDPRFKGAK